MFWDDATEATKLPPEDKGDLIVRKKSHEIKPMFVEDAIEQMEMLGHDFFFFLNAETEQYNVVYRRRAGGYGWIVPAFGDLDTSDLPAA
jgi:putative sigma-54 modulation protein